MKVSRQLAWQQRNLGAGLCRSCGRYLVWWNKGKEYKFCRRCLDKKKRLYRKKKP